MLVTCLNCSNEFDKKPFEIKKSPRHFCSRSCSAQLNNRGKTKNPPKPHSCKTCGQTFYRNSRIARRSKTHCPPCYASKPEDRNLTLRDISSSEHLKGKHPSWRWSQVRYFARSWNSQLLSLPCHVCGYAKHVELAHVRAISDFPETATLGEVNAPSNVIQLCRNCHWEFDHGIIAIVAPPLGVEPRRQG